jgi:hypothetical protein
VVIILQHSNDMSANITLCNDGDAKITTIPLCNILTAHKYHKHWNILHVDDYTLATTLYDSASLEKWNFYSIFMSILIITTELYLHSDAYNMDLCKLQTKFHRVILADISLECCKYFNMITYRCVLGSYVMSCGVKKPYLLFNMVASGS